MNIILVFGTVIVLLIVGTVIMLALRHVFHHLSSPGKKVLDAQMEVCPKCDARLEHFSGLEQCPEYLYCPICMDWAYDFDGKRLFGLE